MASHHQESTRFVTAKTGAKPSSPRRIITVAVVAVIISFCIGLGVGIGAGVSIGRGKNNNTSPNPNATASTVTGKPTDVLSTESTSKPTGAGVTSTTPSSLSLDGGGGTIVTTGISTTETDRPILPPFPTGTG
ncbi:hypothetical protein CPB86DRAFT_813419 [Serendipita vermifera]|nr:hypothetical protein CPB86DRAFT_813419 [Serendipita vermifera]